MTTIADRIDIAMKFAGIRSQSELGRLSGVPNSSIVRILKSESQPSIENLSAIANACKVSIDWIVTGENLKPNNSSDISLVYVTAEELRLLTQFREANDMGKSLIKTTCSTVPKQLTARPNDES